LLPNSARVRKGDCVNVATIALANTLTPSYHFDVMHHPVGKKNSAVSLGSLDITFDELYPDYDDI
jgi:hypothetical protein